MVDMFIDERMLENLSYVVDDLNLYIVLLYKYCILVLSFYMKKYPKCLLFSFSHVEEVDGQSALPSMNLLFGEMISCST